ncbi:MAG: ABC transporter permease [Cytophagia bacterium]|nr:ABC transporter permease [Cytophagia bacterium]
MLKNHLKLAFRRLIKNRFYTLINLLGLSVGFASVLIIFLFVRKERSFDKFHSKLDRIEHLAIVTKRDNSAEKSTRTSGPILVALAPDYPSIEAYSRYEQAGVNRFVSDSTTSEEFAIGHSTFWVDSKFNEIFDFKLKYGQYPDFDNDLSAIMITESKAKVLFETGQNAIGRSVFSSFDKKEYIVKGVIEDIPESSSLRFDCLSSMTGAYPHVDGKPNFIEMWGNNIVNNVVLFKEGTTSEQKQLIANKLGNSYNTRATYQELPSSFEFQPFKEAHFDLATSDHFRDQTDESYLLIFSTIALVILFASLANYCSLTLSQSVERIKEIGVKRTVGASTMNLIGHYFFESLLLTSSAFILALILIEVSVPGMEDVINKSLGVELFSDIGLLFTCFGVVTVISFLSILYPAYIASRKGLSNFKAVGSSPLFGRTSFIYIVNCFQVAIFVFLLAATLFVNQQLDFVQNENLGFNKEHVLMVSVNTRESIFKKNELKASFVKSPYVQHAAIASSYPVEHARPRYAKKEDLNFIEYTADAEFLRVFDFDLIEGRPLENLEHHRNYTLVNETAVEALGYEEPIGKDFNGKEIIGVVADFHAESKRELIKPLSIRLFDADGYGWVLMRLKSENIQAAMDDVLERYEEVTGSSKITYRFFDEQYDKIYASEKVIKYLMQIFTGIALLISFFGVFGSSSYAVRRRVKEISIRKVLGANLIDLNRAINKSGLRYLFISALVAIPLSYWWINDWLTQFSYQINVGAFNYAPVLMITALLIIPAMLFQVVKVYHAKTVNYLKDE